MRNRYDRKGDQVTGTRQWLRVWCSGLVLLNAGLVAASAQEAVDFAHDVLPILRSRCAECHTNGVFKGGLSLESRSSLLDSGAVEPGDAAASELWLRITSEDPDSRMPPGDEPLTPEQRQALRRWIDEGLSWPAELTLRESRFSRPLALQPAADPAESGDTGNPVDLVLQDYFAKQQIEFPPLVDDRHFIRRLKLDLLGLLPTAEEVQRFVRDEDPDKHEHLVDEFLARNRDYADHWLSFWNDLLRNDYAGTGYIDGGRRQITGWLHRSLMDNKPYDHFAMELIDASPESAGFIEGIKWRGEVNASQIRPLQFSQNVSQVFLGINMKCASCHDSFIDDWKLSDAYGLAAVVAEQTLAIHRCDVATGQLATSKFVFPEVGDIDGSLPRDQRLKQLAELLTSPRNGRFPRTMVNRLWQRMTGRGLVHPVDVMANEAWSEPLLETLAVRFAGPWQYDLKQVLRTIATSRIYRGLSVPEVAPQDGSGFVFRGIGRKRMTAEQLVDAVWRLTERFPESMAAAIEASEDHAPVRASLVQADLLMRSLGRPNREQVVTTRPAELSTLQALDLSNGELLTQWIRHGATVWLQRRQDRQWTDRQLVTSLYLTALSRPPTGSELQVLTLDESSDLQPQVEDFLWILIMLPEFQLIQ
jgi:hypothetical protein